MRYDSLPPGLLPVVPEWHRPNVRLRRLQRRVQQITELRARVAALETELGGAMDQQVLGILNTRRGPTGHGRNQWGLSSQLARLLVYTEDDK